MAGGTESISLIPMGGHKIAPNPTLLERYPDAYLGMGLTAGGARASARLHRRQADGAASG